MVDAKDRGKRMERRGRSENGGRRRVRGRSEVREARSASAEAERRRPKSESGIGAASASRERGQGSRKRRDGAQSDRSVSRNRSGGRRRRKRNDADSKERRPLSADRALVKRAGKRCATSSARKSHTSFEMVKKWTNQDFVKGNVCRRLRRSQNVFNQDFTWRGKAQRRATMFGSVLYTKKGDCCSQNGFWPRKTSVCFGDFVDHEQKASKAQNALEEERWLKEYMIARKLRALCAHKDELIESVFRQYDQDGSGELDIAEFQTMLLSFGVELNSKEISFLVNEVGRGGLRVSIFEWRRFISNQNIVALSSTLEFGRNFGYDNDLETSLKRLYDPKRMAPRWHPLYTLKALARRDMLKFESRVRRCLNFLWKKIDLDKSGRIEFDEYTLMHEKICHVMADLGKLSAKIAPNGKLNIEEQRKLALEDWSIDNQGFGFVDYTRFVSCWFQIADQFTDNITVDEYESFLMRVITKLFPSPCASLDAACDTALAVAKAAYYAARLASKDAKFISPALEEITSKGLDRISEEWRAESEMQHKDDSEKAVRIIQAAARRKLSRFKARRLTVLRKELPQEADFNSDLVAFFQTFVIETEPPPPPPPPEPEEPIVPSEDIATDTMPQQIAKEITTTTPTATVPAPETKPECNVDASLDEMTLRAERNMRLRELLAKIARRKIANFIRKNMFHEITQRRLLERWWRTRKSKFEGGDWSDDDTVKSTPRDTPEHQDDENTLKEQAAPTRRSESQLPCIHCHAYAICVCADKRHKRYQREKAKQNPRFLSKEEQQRLLLLSSALKKKKKKYGVSLAIDDNIGTSLPPLLLKRRRLASVPETVC